MSDPRAGLLEALAALVPADAREAGDRVRIGDFVRRHRDPFDRAIVAGHLTGSALIIAEGLDRVLLLHHKRLERWLQPGGHADPGEARGEAVALREAREETGLEGLVLHPTAPRPFDVDVHEIPARGAEAAHLHLDLRYLVLAPGEASLVRAVEESNDLRWFAWDALPGLDLDPGLTRAYAKAARLVGV